MPAEHRPITLERPHFAGDDLSFLLLVTTGPPIKARETAAAASTTIQVEPLKAALSSGDKVRFGYGPDSEGIVVTLSANAAFGATSLAVSSTSGAVQAGMTGKKVQNITDWTMELVVYDKQGGTALVTLTVGDGLALSSATDGEATPTLTDTQTEAIGTTPRYYRSRRTNEGNEKTIAYGTFVLRE